MSLLFEPIEIGRLQLRNRVMRSATAERAADAVTGAPTERLASIYRDLAAGGVGLIVTGHACISMAGRAHPRMAAIDDDALIPAWREAIRPAQDAGARLMMQINYAGASAQADLHEEALLCPSGIPTGAATACRAMSGMEIAETASRFGEAARRAQAAGFDGVQIHGAHGYLVSQFLSPYTNRRTDEWGGDPARRRAFLARVIGEIRARVGADYPVWIKLGVAGNIESGLTAEEGAAAAGLCAELGVDAIEVSHGLGISEALADNGEGRFMPMAEAVRRQVPPDYPLALVMGFRTRVAMERALEGNVVQAISLCRPLIAEPDLVARMAVGAEEAACVRCGRCWPDTPEDWVRCRNQAVLRKVAAT